MLYDDADRIDSGVPVQQLEVEGFFAPLLQWVLSRWVPTGGEEMALEPLVLAAYPSPEGPRKQDGLVALEISVDYRQHTSPVAWHIVGGPGKGVQV